MNKYRFTILRPQFLSTPEEIKEINQLYSIWRKTFSEVVNAKGGKIDPDDFFRQNFIFSLKYGDEPIAFNLGTVFDFRVQNHVEHHFINGLTEPVIEKIQSTGIDRILSLEYSMLMPEWRKSKSATDIIWAEVLVAVGTLFADNNTDIIDGIIGTPRTDVKMHRIGESLGYVTVCEEIKKMDYPCAVQISSTKKDRKFNNPQTDEMARSLWNSRIDLINKDQQKPLKIAA